MAHRSNASPKPHHSFATWVSLVSAQSFQVRIGQSYRDAIEAGRERTLNFDTGQPTHRHYTLAKVIDMIFSSRASTDDANRRPRTPDEQASLADPWASHAAEAIGYRGT